MRTVTVRRAATILAAAATLGLAGGCARPVDRAAREPVPLVIHNHGYHHVAVDLVREDGAPGRCLGTVAGYASVSTHVHRGELHPGRVLVLRVRTVGTRHVWTGPGVAVPYGRPVYLDVVTSNDGDLRGTRLSTTPGEVAVR